MSEIPRWLEAVRAGVAELSEHYGGYWRREKIVFGSCPTEKELAVREQELGIRLPNDYRNFLLHIGNGGFGPGLGLRFLPIHGSQNTPAPFSLQGLSDKYGPHSPPEIRYAPIFRIRPESVSEPFPFENATLEDFPEGECGLLEISYYGMGCQEILVVAGAEYSHVWGMDTDGIAPYEECSRARDGLLWEPLRPHRYTFKDWYLDWLQAMLNTARRASAQ